MDFDLIEKLSETKIKDIYDEIIENDLTDTIGVYCFWKITCTNGRVGFFGYNISTQRTVGNCYPASPGADAEVAVCERINQTAAYACLMDKR